MVKRIISFAFFCIAIAGFSSCQKELSSENNFLPGTGGGGTGGGGGNPQDTTGCKSCAYQPWCQGMSYTYRDSTSTGPTTSTEILNILADTLIDGKTYKKSDFGTGSVAYFNCTNGVVTLVGFQASSTGGTTPTRVNTTILKENEPVGATWTETNTVSTGVDNIYDYEIIAKGISRTVLGVTFPDVIHVHQVLSVTAPFVGSIPISETDYYFARGVGQIESAIVDANFGSLILSRKLQSYMIP